MLQPSSLGYVVLEGPWTHGESCLGLGLRENPHQGYQVTEVWGEKRYEKWKEGMEDDWVHVEYGLWVKWNDMHASNDGYESGIFSL